MAFWIVIHHTSGFGFGFYNEGEYGYFAVDVFILSGYVLMLNHLRQFKRIGISEIWLFLRQRWWRVYPVYLLSVILSLGLFHLLHGVWPGPRRIVKSWLILDFWARPGIGVNGPAWSLGVEWIGYCAFPFIVFGLSRLGLAARLILLAAAPAFAAIFIARHSGVWHIITGPQPVVQMATGFIAGCILVTLRPSVPAWLTRHGDWLIGAAICGAVAMVLLNQTLYVAPFLILLVFGVAHAGPLAARVLDNRLALFAGRISFSLYITHYIVIRAVMLVFGVPATTIGQLTSTICLVVVVLAVAWMTCVTVEEPARRWRRARGPRRALIPDVPSAP